VKNNVAEFMCDIHSQAVWGPSIRYSYYWHVAIGSGHGGERIAIVRRRQRNDQHAQCFNHPKQ
jgi:hypothetical protein